MRLFIGIDLPDKAKKEISEQIEPLRLKYPDFNWIDSVNYHLTIHFIGESQHVKLIEEKIKNCLFDQFSFYLYAYNIDLFLGQKIILYLTFRREKKLEEMAEKLKINLKSFDQKNEDVKFVAHLTLARYRIPSKQQYLLIKKTVEKKQIEVEFPVNKIYLFQSVLSASKPTQKRIAGFSLIK